MGPWQAPRDAILNLIQDLVKAMEMNMRSLGKNGLKEAPLVYKIRIPQSGKGNFEGSTRME